MNTLNPDMAADDAPHDAVAGAAWFADRQTDGILFTTLQKFGLTKDENDSGSTTHCWRIGATSAHRRNVVDARHAPRATHPEVIRGRGRRRTAHHLVEKLTPRLGPCPKTNTDRYSYPYPAKGWRICLCHRKFRCACVSLTRSATSEKSRWTTSIW